MSEYPDVVGIVEVTNYESLCLWQEYHQKLGYTWEESRSGPIITVGHIDSHPVAIAPLVHVVNGKKILFVEATSVVVSWKLIDDWLYENCPKARNGTYLNKRDAMNFFSLIG